MKFRQGQLSIGMAVVALLLAGLALLTQVRTAQAAGVVGDGTPAGCTDSAIQDAFDSGNGTISFNCGSAPITITVSTRVIAGGGVYTLDGNNKVVLDGENLRQLFRVENGGDLTLRNLTLMRAANFNGSVARIAPNGSLTVRNVTLKQNGLDTDRGGALYNEGLLEVERSTFLDNETDLAGGAIYNAAGALASVRTSHLVGNDAFNPVGASGDGGAIYNLGNLTIDGSTLFGNDAKRHGGGVYTQGGSLEITNSTLVENTAGTIGRGGAINASGATSVSLLNVTIERNNADIAGGIWNGAAVTLENTIVSNSSTTADNGTPSLDCDGPSVVSNGHNLIGDGSCVDGLNPTDQRNTEPRLSFIDDNGGPTPTLMLLPDSPAIDAADNGSCPTRDQRGAQRPVGPSCDVGAVEYGAAVDEAGNALSFLPLVSSD